MAGVNCATIMLDSSRRKRIDIKRSFLAAYDNLKELWQQRTHRHHERQMMVAVVSPEGRVQGVVLPAEKFLILGRHTQCALRLEDPDVSLRHLAVQWSLAGDLPLIRVWDLQTGAAFRTEDEQSTRSVVAEHLFFGSIGGYTLLVVPLGPEPPLDSAAYAWAALPARQFASARLPSERSLTHHVITVTHTLPALVFGAEGSGSQGTAVGQIRVEGKEGAIECRVSSEHLERGLLFGRYDRCKLSLIGDERLSRVHLLVVRVADQLWAVDTASTNGTHRNGSPISSMPLSGATSLLLGRECLFQWSINTPRAVEG